MVPDLRGQECRVEQSLFDAAGDLVDVAAPEQRLQRGWWLRTPSGSAPHGRSGAPESGGRGRERQPELQERAEAEPRIPEGAGLLLQARTPKPHAAPGGAGSSERRGRFAGGSTAPTAAGADEARQSPERHPACRELAGQERARQDALIVEALEHVVGDEAETNRFLERDLCDSDATPLRGSGVAVAVVRRTLHCEYSLARCLLLREIDQFFLHDAHPTRGRTAMNINQEPNAPAPPLWNTYAHRPAIR